MNKMRVRVMLLLLILSLVFASIACDITKGCNGPLCKKDTKYVTLSSYIDAELSQPQINATLTARVPYLTGEQP